MRLLHLLSITRTLRAFSFIRAGEIILVKGSAYRLSSRIDAALAVRRQQISKTSNKS